MLKPRIFIGKFYLGTRQQRGKEKWVGGIWGSKLRRPTFLEQIP